MFVILWLHAYKYQYKAMKVETKKPEWAHIDFKFGKTEAESKVEAKQDENENKESKEKE